MSSVQHPANSNAKLKMARKELSREKRLSVDMYITGDFGVHFGDVEDIFKKFKELKDEFAASGHAKEYTTVAGLRTGRHVYKHMKAFFHDYKPPEGNGPFPIDEMRVFLSKSLRAILEYAFDLFKDKADLSDMGKAWIRQQLRVLTWFKVYNEKKAAHDVVVEPKEGKHKNKRIRKRGKGGARVPRAPPGGGEGLRFGEYPRI